MPKPPHEAEAARRAVENANVLHLAREDQIRFAEALIHPSMPGERLAHAAERHADIIAKQ